jgi:hypothetical protein
MKTGNNPETATAFVNMQEMKGSNFYALETICKSYNTIIASHEKGVILLTSYDYSNTTQRHKLHIRRAAKNTTLFEVPICYNWNGLTPDQHRENVAYLLREAETMRAKADRARTYKTFYRLQEEKYRQAAEDYTNIFQL